MIDIRTKIGKLRFDSPIMNASGVWCTTEKELEDLGKSASGAIVFKTMTVNPREGNPEPRLAIKGKSSVNSMGLPNLGVDFYAKVVDSYKKFNKPLIASIAGFTEKEYYILFEKIKRKPFDAFEINLSCPNLVGKGIFAYDIPASLKILKKIRSGTNKTVGVKLPPYNEREDIRQMAEGLVKLGIDLVTLINSVPLGCIIDAEKEIPSIKPNLGIGGLGGEAIKPIALAQVILFRYFSKGKLGIIGTGGVNRGLDIYEYILAGASAVGVATILKTEGPKVFQRLEKELKQYLGKKKVPVLKDKIGRLKQRT